MVLFVQTAYEQKRTYVRAPYLILHIRDLLALQCALRRHLGSSVKIDFQLHANAPCKSYRAHLRPTARLTARYLVWPERW